MPGLLLGSTLVSTRFSLGQFAPLTHVTVRLSLAAVAFLVAIFVFRVRPWPRDRNLWQRAVVYGLIGTAITMSGYTNSLKYQSSGVTSLLASLSPVVTALLAHVFLHDEQINRFRITGALIAFGGAGLLLIRGESGLAELTRADWRGYAWALLGMASNSAGLVYARRYLRTADSFTITFVRILTGAVVVGILTAFTAGFDFSEVQWSGVGAVFYAAIFGTFLAFIYYMSSVQKLGATVASQTEFLVPMVATGLGVLLLNERVTPAMLIGMTLIFIGLGVFGKGASRASAATVKVKVSEPETTEV